MTAACLGLVMSLSMGVPPRAAEFGFEALPAGAGKPRLVLAPRPGATAVMLVTFAAGSFDDGQRPGLTRLAQHTLLEANERGDYGELLAEVFRSGGRLDMETGVHDAQFVLTADARDFGTLAPRVARMLLAPVIDRGRFPLARARAHQDERQLGKGATLLPFLAQVAFTDARYQTNPYGDSSIQDVEADEVAVHLRSALTPANATIVLTGSFDRALMLRELARFAGGAARPRERPELTLPLSSMIPSGVEMRILGYPFAVRSPTEAAAVRILAELLQQRILERFRGEGIGYSPTVWPVHTTWLDVLLLVLPAHDALTDLSSAMREVVDEVAGDRLPEGLFERARGYAYESLRWIDRHPRELAAELTTPWYGKSTAEAARSMSRQELITTAAPWLSSKRAISVVFTPNARQRR